MTKLIPLTGTYHFSIDDVFNSLIEVSDKNISLFDHPIFKFTKSLHDQFGANIECYLFYQEQIDGKTRNLQEVSSEIKQTIQVNPWLRFGPHALDYQNAPYAQKPVEAIEAFNKIYAEIERFAGEMNFSNFARLHYFSELYELADYFSKKKVKALFTTDKDVLSHRMPNSIKNSLASKGVAGYKGMNFIRTQFRVEYFINSYKTNHERNTYLKNLLDKFGFIIFFTHERDVSNPKVRQAIITSLKSCKNFGLVSI